MARPVVKRFRVSGTLIAETPIAVGGAGTDPATDLPLARDGADDYYIPGTSLAGALRQWWRQTLVDGSREPLEGLADDELWGFTPKRGQPAEEGFASLVLVEDARVEATAPAELRDGVGIDRIAGRAADGIKYDRQILPKGSRIAFSMTVEVPFLPDALKEGRSEDEIARLKRALERAPGKVAAALGQMLRTLAEEGARLGAAKTRGLGKVKLAEGCQVFEETLNTRDGILQALAGSPKPLDGFEALLERARDVRPAARPRLDIAIDWRPCGPVMVKSDAEGLSVDILPLVSGTDGRLAQIIPGASVKGVLRAQAERIWRTLWLKDNEPTPEDFLKQLQQSDLVEALFGAPGKGREPRDDQEDDWPDDVPLPGLGALSVEDCFAGATIDQETWRKLVAGGDRPAAGGSENDGGEDKSMEPLLAALGGTDWEGHYPATRVAIDRWTGGAADGFLYTVLEPGTVGWPAIRLSVDLHRLADREDERKSTKDNTGRDVSEKPEAWRKRVADRPPGERMQTQLAAVALLFLALRDLARGRLPIGYGGNRGLGAIEVERIGFTLRGADGALAAELAGLDGFALTPALLKDAKAEAWSRLEPLQAVWQARAPQPERGAR